MARGRVLRFPQLESEKGIDYHRSHVDRLERQGAFPKRVKLGSGTRQGAVGWWEDEIDDWLERRPRGMCPSPKLERREPDAPTKPVRRRPVRAERASAEL